MKLYSFSIEDLIVAGNAAVREFTSRLGYDYASFMSVRVSDFRISIQFELTDDFQKDLSSSEQYLAGWNVDVDLGSDGAGPEDINPTEFLYNEVMKWPTRAQRELHVMASQLAKVGKSCDGMVTMQVAAFVEQIRDAQSKLARLENLTNV
jgi:hypothetical protein